MDYAKINEAAKNYEADMTKFLRDLVKIPEKAAVKKVTSCALKKKWRNWNLTK